MRVLITGGSGQLGRALRAVYGRRDEIYAPPHEELDLANLLELRRALASFAPNLIVHAAALTDVDGCESRVEEAFHANALTTRHLALLAAAHDLPLVYISTNFVFDGAKEAPYHEWDRTAPLSVYGLSKLAGEEEVRRHARRHFVIRTAMIYDADPHSRNFVRTILRLAEGGQQPLRVVADQFGQPTYAPDLAKAVVGLVATEAYGLYHLTNSGACSWHEWAQELLRLSGRDVVLEPIPASAWARPAAVPANGVLANWAAAALGIALPDWRDGLRRCLAELEPLPDAPAGGAAPAPEQHRADA